MVPDVTMFAFCQASIMLGPSNYFVRIINKLCDNKYS